VDTGRAVDAKRAVELLHESALRLRCRYPPGTDVVELRARLERLPGVQAVRINEPILSVAVAHDGRGRTRDAVFATIAASGPAPGSARPVRAAPVAARRVPAPRQAARPLPVVLPAAVAATIPWVPPLAQQVLGVGIAAAKALADLRGGRGLGAVTVEAVSLATTAVTGNALASATSVTLGTVATAWRDRLVERNEQLLGHLSPPESEAYAVHRGGRALALAPAAIEVGDRVSVPAGDVVPVDGVARRGGARLASRAHHEPAATRPVRPGESVRSGARVADGTLELVVLRRQEESRAQRLREHVRYALSAHERPGAITPDPSRLLSLPVLTAGVVLALTRDAGRSAAMLQADPEEGLALAHPLAREAALNLLAREGLLMPGLAAVDRLAVCGAIALQDVGVLTESHWQVLRIDRYERSFTRDRATRLLLRLAPAQAAAGAGPEALRIPDDAVRAWREHGVVVALGKGATLHVGGASVMRRTWGVEVPPSAPWPGVTRRLAVVCDGRLGAMITLGAALRPGAAECLASLRRLGVGRIAVFGEDIGGTPCADLATLGADAVITESRQAQAAWLEESVAKGLAPALVHRGLRDLLPPGGLSLCPVEADAGADGVMLSDPFTSLVAGRAAAVAVRERLRTDFGAAFVVNSALIVASALRLMPPVATAALHHAFVLALLRRSDTMASMPMRAPRAQSMSKPELGVER